MGINVQLASSKWVLYLIRNKVGLYTVSTFKSIINDILQKTINNELDSQEVNNLVSKCTKSNFQ